VVLEGSEPLGHLGVNSGKFVGGSTAFVWRVE